MAGLMSISRMAIVSWFTKATQHMEQHVPDFKQQVKVAVKKALEEHEAKE
jgi:hypothetical protein